MNKDSLIGEIAIEATSDSVRLATLLRRVKLAASRLNIPQLEDWVSKELDGYEDDDIVPEYRRVPGQVVVKNPMRGWIPLRGNPGVLDAISVRGVGSSIASLEAMVDEGKSGGTFKMFFAAEFTHQVLGEQANYLGPMANQISLGSIIAILDRVRGKVLDWAIEMERQGIVGYGMTFTPKEKEVAAAMTNINFNGPIGNIAGNIGSGNTSGDINLNPRQAIEIIRILESLRSSSSALVDTGAKSEFTNIIDTLSEEAAQASPNKEKMKTLASDARTALVGAAGTVMGTGAIAMVEKIISILAS
mgnify:CR=1 FL=1